MEDDDNFTPSFRAESKPNSRFWCLKTEEEEEIDNDDDDYYYYYKQQQQQPLSFRNQFRNCIWLALVLLAFGQARVGFGYLTRIFTCLLLGSILWLLKALLVDVLASSFQLNMFFDRVRDSLYNQYLVLALSGPHPSLKATIFKKTGISIDRLRRLTKNKVSAWHMKRLMDAVKVDVLSSPLDDHLDNAAHITKEERVKRAARKMVNNVAKHGSQRIYLADLMHFLGEDEALKVIHLFNGESETNGISKEILEKWAVNVFRDRRALALSLKDTTTAINELHKILSFVVGVLICVICLLILELVNALFVMILSFQLLLTAFVFSSICETTFEAIVFFFVMHPFDVGDRCDIDGVQLIVEKMHILTTVFLTLDNQTTTYLNSVLAMKPITNYRLCPDTEDAIDLCVHISTPAEKIVLMKEHITRYIENDSDHWYPKPKILVRGFEGLTKLKISIRPTHRMNFQDMDERWARRGVLVEEILKVCQDLDIEEYCSPAVDSKS